MKNCSERTIRWGAGAVTTALVYHAEPPRREHARPQSHSRRSRSALARTQGSQAPPEPPQPPPASPPDIAHATLVLAHGAGAGQRSAFMVEYAAALANAGLDVVTFNFLYTEQGRRMPDRAPALEDCYRAVIEAVHVGLTAVPQRLFIGGKSMGGRIATQVAASDPALPVDGLVLLGYPLHPPGKPERLRDGHLPSVGRPMLFVQGSRDAFGTPTELAPIVERIVPAPSLHVVNGGDHSFKLSRRNPTAQAETHDAARRAIVDWVGTTIGRS